MFEWFKRKPKPPEPTIEELIYGAELPKNVVPAIFDPEFTEKVYHLMKLQGGVPTSNALIAQGHHPAFVNALLKRIRKTKGKV